MMVLKHLTTLLFKLMFLLMLMVTKPRWFWLTGEPSQEAIGMTRMTLSAFTSLLPYTG